MPTHDFQIKTICLDSFTRVHTYFLDCKKSRKLDLLDHLWTKTETLPFKGHFYENEPGFKRFFTDKFCTQNVIFFDNLLN